MLELNLEEHLYVPKTRDRSLAPPFGGVVVPSP
ncbi:hypothetical protein AVEN_75615-1, partial [Araneus ventricosus]